MANVVRAPVWSTWQHILLKCQYIAADQAHLLVWHKEWLLLVKWLSVNQRESCFAEQSHVTTACDFSLPFYVTIRSACIFSDVLYSYAECLYQSWYLAAAQPGWCWATGAPLCIVQVFWPQFLPLSGLCLASAVLLNLCWCYYLNKVTACLYFDVHSVLSNGCIRHGYLLMCMATVFLRTTMWITLA